jgi:hypothetical protein
MENLFNASLEQSKINNEEIFEIEPSLIESISGGCSVTTTIHKNGSTTTVADHVN